MFGLFKKKSATEKLEKQYKALMEDAFKLSKTDRTQSDLKHQEADEIMKKIEELRSKA